MCGETFVVFGTGGHPPPALVVGDWRHAAQGTGYRHSNVIRLGRLRAARPPFEQLKPRRAPVDSGAHSKVYRYSMPASPKSTPRPRPVSGEPTQAKPPLSAAVLRIGDLAARAGVSADTLRYYERRGLLQPSGRRASGYREYPPEAAGIVHFIKHAQELGFTLAEIDELLQLRGSAARRGTGLAVHDVAVAKIRDIDEKMRMLGTLRRALSDLVVECEQTCGPDTVVDARDCPIIAALSVESLAHVEHDSADATDGRAGRGSST